MYNVCVYIYVCVSVLFYIVYYNCNDTFDTKIILFFFSNIFAFPLILLRFVWYYFNLAEKLTINRFFLC